MTQKKAGTTAKTKKAVQDPANDPINNVSDELDQNANGAEDEDDDFDASTGEGPGPIGLMPEQQPPAPPAQAPQAPEKTQKKAGTTQPDNFEEWRVEVRGGKVEKLKKLRDNVKISEAEAETLNHGALGQANATYHVMYFKPE